MIIGWNDEENKSTACGSSCGSNTPTEPATPSACGASTPTEPTKETPSACGTACGAGK